MAHNRLPEEIQEVDIIIAGGGTAACIIASRLADADPELSILVVESGRDNYKASNVIHPALWRQNYLPNNPRILFHKAAKESQLGDRESMIQVGNTLGGGSSINLMMYVRAQQRDFDSWNMEGWTGDDLLPYLRKVETYHGPGKGQSHGYDGPIQVSRGTYCSAVSENDFISAMGEVGFSRAADLQDLESVGIESIQKYISPEGIRQDTAHAYLHPRLRDGKHPNLHVLVETQVIRVIFDDSLRASGIEFQPNPTFQPGSENSTTRIVRARRLVVASCGTLGTPPILERSGVGNKDILKRVDVPLVANVPGVGHDYQDHHLCIHTYKTNLPPGATTDEILSGQSDIPGLLASEDPILGWNGIDSTSKIRPTAKEVESLGQNFKDLWNEDFETQKDKPLVSMIFHAGLLGDRTNVPQGQYMSLAAFTAYPYSRGHVHITGKDMVDRPELVTGFLTDKSGFDLKAQIWAYKKQREVVQHMQIHQGVVPHRNPSFAPNSAAAYSVDSESNLGPSSSVHDIAYSLDDDKVIEDWIRKNLTTCWHGLGTCKMAPLESLGVVDQNLSVYGVRGLKVADLSIVPQNIGSNTMNTALIIGEKAADIFIRELGLGS